MADKATFELSGRAREPRDILIVDDEESLTFFLKQGLLEVNDRWQIDTAGTGISALIRINRYAYGLVIADLRMPGLNGLELLQMVRAVEPDTQVILMTAYGSEQVEAEARRLGAFRYVTKPFEMEDMKRWAKEALSQRPPRGSPDAKTPVPKPPPASVAKAPPDVSQARPPEPPPASAAKAPPVTSQAKPPEPKPLAPPAKPGKPAEGLAAPLAQLALRIGARCALLVDLQGAILAQIGAQDLSVAPLAQAIASGVQAFHSVGSALGNSGLSLFAVQKSDEHELYTMRVGDAWVLAVLYDKPSQGCPLTVILGRMEEAAQALLALPRLQAPEQSPLAPQPKPPAEAETPAEEQVFSLEEARALGLIDDELWSKLQE